MNNPILTLSPMEMTRKIKDKARYLGFDLVGIAPAKSLNHYSFYESWVEKGFAGQMAYLERGKKKRKDPTLILEGSQSIICCAINYYTHPKDAHDPNYGQVSNYAWGKDYHDVMMDKFKALEDFIKIDISANARMKSYVDTGPILERSYAQAAGLGWIGKNTCLIHPKHGSWFFLGEILTDLKLEFDSPFEVNHCGTCTRCIDACPTQAIKEPGVLDARDCISYLTIEHRGEIPEKKRPWLENHLSGCDICQDVCPFNHHPIPSTHQAFYPNKHFSENGPGRISLHALAQLAPEEFNKDFSESPLKRLKYEGLIRNAVIAMGNSKNLKYIKMLESMKERISDLVLQQYIQWSIEQLIAIKN